ncbi:AAEL006327-PA [Aedes aegypti]|uniref:AAEL006327-PA n=2 Tax=Aedes aegypti TaxID=7159 RepID=A0A1S4FDA4_AEDAE|nr:estrogen sulfotransferase [Aedes aegypti]EAT42081.1 AAEL006327-PA [Aedes aegypti]
MEYTDVTDPEYLATRAEFNEPDCFWVKPTDYSMVPNQGQEWKPLPCFLPKEYASMAQRIKNLQVKPEDVWIASYPKSGTTWTQEMMWLICNDLDYAGARAVTLDERFPFLEIGSIIGNDSVKEVEEMKSPRFIKTHLPVALIPDQFWTVKPKLVYVYRKAKPVPVSFYHHYQTLTGYRGTIEQFVKSFINDRIMFSPYHEHVLEYHALQGLDNILVINYEDMKKDLKSTVFKVCSFFNKTYTEDQIQQLCKHLSFDSMKNNPSVNYDHLVKQMLMLSNRLHERDDADRKFIRKGEVDGWKSDLTEDLANKIDEWTRSKIKSPEQLKLFL